MPAYRYRGISPERWAAMRGVVFAQFTGPQSKRRKGK